LAAVAALGVAAAGLGVACGPRARSDESFCPQLKAVEDLDDVLAGADATLVGQRARELQDLRSAAPEELEPHLTRLAAVTDDLAHTLGTTPDPDAAASEVFTRRQGELADITASGRAVEAYATEHCQLVLNPTGPTGAPGAPPATAPATSRRAGPSTSTTRRTATTRGTTRSSRSGTTGRASTTRPRATTTTRRG
jgi:hypothetical protein